MSEFLFWPWTGLGGHGDEDPSNVVVVLDIAADYAISVGEWDSILTEKDGMGKMQLRLRWWVGKVGTMGGQEGQSNKEKSLVGNSGDDGGDGPD